MIILHVWRQQPGQFFCLSTKSRSGEWKDHFFRRSQFKDVAPFIAENQDKDVYWCVHGFRKPRRVKTFAEIPKLLWADLDEADPRDMEDFMPTVAWESSPGRYAAIWVLDRYMTEDINRKLTYHLKADPGGWDLTQVLRVPGSLNHKYASKPKVRLMWQDGPVYNLAELEKKLPGERKQKEHNVARGLYKKYEKNFSGWVRRQLMKGKAKPGMRSQVLWRLVHELIEAGCSSDEAFELLRVSPWNKFAGRRDGDQQLKREIDKSIGQHMLVEHDEDPPEAQSDADEEDDGSDDEEEDSYRYLARSMAEVEEENIDWIWYPYLARGELTILEGDPGLGKSYLAQMIAKGICDGERLPCVKRGLKAVQGKVAYFDIENATSTVTKKRLVANGAKNLAAFFQEPEPFSIDEDEVMDDVYTAIEQLKPTLVVFDTLNTYMGGADTHKASETQQTFKRFIDIARRFNCAVLVLRHLTKSSKGDKALYRGQGSIAFAGLARVVITVGVSPDDPETRVMAVTKINVCRPPKALTFTIVSLPDTLKDQDRSKFVWGEFVDLSSDDILAMPDREQREEMSKELEACVEWLKEFLSDGPQPYSRIKQSASTRSINEKLIHKAAEEIGIEKIETKRDGLMWTLPVGGRDAA